LTVFEKFAGYGFIHHRALNSPADLAAAMSLVSSFPERTHILEGDICWDFSGGRSLFYFRHPSAFFDTLPPERVERDIARGRLVTLESLDVIKGTNAFFVVELKVGRGDRLKALRSLAGYLESHFQGRYWIDSFSLTMIEYVKSISPRTTVTLHTEFVLPGRAIVSAPEWPPLRLRRPSSLTSIDGVSIRRHGCESYMARACRDVREAGKTLLLSRLDTLRHFECSKMWGAVAGYIHGDFRQLVEFNDELDARRAPEREKR
jgi:hypothetical protein